MVRIHVGRCALALTIAAGMCAGALPALSLRAQDSGKAAVSGRVVDVTTDQPVAGAQVGILRRIWPYRETQSVVTDAAGRFELVNLDGGFHELSASHEAYIRVPGDGDGSPPSGRLVDLVPGRTLSDVTLGLGRRAAVSGAVRDDAGEPVVNAEVTALRRESSVAGGLQSMGTARTDDRGAYRIPLRQTGDYLIFARPREDFLPRSQARESHAPTFAGTFHPAAPRPSQAAVVFIGHGDERAGVDVRLEAARGVTVSGVVDDFSETGRLLDLFLLPLDGSEPLWDLPLGMVRTAPGGRFAFAGVPPGRYVISGVSFPPRPGGPLMQRRPWSPNSFGIIGIRPGQPVGAAPDGETLWTEVKVTIGESDVADLALPLTRGAHIRGRVVFDGAAGPPSPAELQALSVTIMPMSAKPLGAMPVAGVGADGTFSTVGLPPGDYRVGVAFETAVWSTRSRTAGGRNINGQPLSVGSSDIDDFVQTFSDRRTRLSGVVNDRTGNPFADQFVVVFPVDRARWAVGGSVAALTSTSQRGTFELGIWTGSGEYFVAGLRPDLRNRYQEPAVLEELSRSAATVRIIEGETASVRVTVRD